jgi:hypothetical protein
MKTQITGADPCAWVSRRDIEHILGPLGATPQRVASAETPQPQVDGEACLYRLGDTTHQLTVQILVDGLTAQEATSSIERRRDSTWDFESSVPGGLTIARQGHLGLRMFRYGVSRAQALAVAARTIERVPDLPFALTETDASAPSWGPDPCTLITRSEAEAVLGRLAVAPYRSRATTPLAYGAGPSCSYYSGRHRVLIVTPSWWNGRHLFQGADVDGRLYFLKGDRMIEMQYRTSAADAVGAARLARAAIKRL